MESAKSKLTTRCAIAGLLAALWLLVASAAATGQEQSTSQPASAPSSQPAATQPAPDKSGYNICHPTPADLLRPMDLDRPNITNTPHTIDAGHVQVETGLADFAHLYDRSAAVNTRSDAWSLGQFNARVGILDNLEFNAIVTAYDFLDSHDFSTGQTTRANGFGDTVVGGKFNFWGNEMGDTLWANSLGIQPQVKLPTAGQNLGNGHAEGQLNVPFLMNLPAGVHLGLMTAPALERNTSNTGYSAGWINSICVDRVFWERYDFFAEYASNVTDQPHRQAQGSVDLGVIYSLSPNVSLDTAVNIGTNRATPAVEWAAGISFRF
jgi:hypothetical protein